MFDPPTPFSDYQIARRLASDLKEIVAFITATRRLTLQRAIAATLLTASLLDGRIRQTTTKATLDVSILLKGMDAQDEKTRQGILKRCTSQIRGFFEKIYRKHKTGICFKSPVAEVAETLHEPPQPSTATRSPASAELTVQRNKKPGPQSLLRNHTRKPNSHGNRNPNTSQKRRTDSTDSTPNNKRAKTNSTGSPHPNNRAKNRSGGGSQTNQGSSSPKPKSKPKPNQKTATKTGTTRSRSSSPPPDSPEPTTLKRTKRGGRGRGGRGKPKDGDDD